MRKKTIIKRPFVKLPKTIPFTQVAYDTLQREVEDLLQKREEVLVRLKAAREMGDLSENGAYTYAKFELRSVDRQLRQKRYLLRFGKVTTKNPNLHQAQFGSTVTLSNGSKLVTYTLVSLHESNPLENKLSIESPIGQAIIDKKVGDLIKVQIPAGEIEYKILKIE